jgi:hypothetical protein
MSAGDRLLLQDALAAAACIQDMWGLRGPDVLLVGSARRQRPDVGDLEFTCRAPAEGGPDVLFEAMDRTMAVEGLFGASTVPVAKPLKGFKRGFGYCDVLVDLHRQDNGAEFQVRVQIHRWAWDGANRGWIELMRTGPTDFGQWFLHAWKRHHGIQPEADASRDGRLIGVDGVPVPTPREEDAFTACGLTWIEPERREAFMANLNRNRSRDAAFLRS